MTVPKMRCPRCNTGGYKTSEAPDGRPEFTCTRCDHRWTCGKDGGLYAKDGAKR